MFVLKENRICLSLAFYALASVWNVVFSQERTVEMQIDSAWNAVWTNFCSPQTRLFYDFLESLEPGKTLDHLPTPEEVDALYPHACGYGTGMEDCAIFLHRAQYSFSFSESFERFATSQATA